MPSISEAAADRGYGVFEERDVDIVLRVTASRAAYPWSAPSNPRRFCTLTPWSSMTVQVPSLRANRERGNVRAAPVPHLNETQRIQALEGFPNRRPTDAVALGEVALAGKRAPDGIAPDAICPRRSSAIASAIRRRPLNGAMLVFAAIERAICSPVFAGATKPPYE